MSIRRAAAASEPHAAQAAREAMPRGNAVDAVVGAVLVAAAEAPSVLLGPLQLLVGGAGAGLMAIDGRVRQPGLGAPRPRGVVAGERVPPPARVGVPALPAALATAHAALGKATLLRVAGPAVESARARAPARASVIEAFARRGAAAMTDEGVAAELVAVAGRAAGGALTRKDLAAVRPAVVPCPERSLASGGILRVPWADARGASGGDVTHVVAAADGNGLVAVACYEVALDGVAVPPLGLLAPSAAAPVMRGETRVRPGDPRPAAAPIALRARRGVVDLALGVAITADAEGALAGVLGRIESSLTVGEALTGAGGRPVAVVWSREGALSAASS
jgi:gamma-glutamyltranspeptidase/glutathione hydrolase